MGDERLLTVADVADLLQVDEQTVRRWIRAGRLVGHNFGGKAGYRIRRADLEAFLATTRGVEEDAKKLAA